MNQPPGLDRSSSAPTPQAGRAPRGSGAKGSAERLRWGLTGLAGIFLLVMAAAAGLRPSGSQARPGTGEPLAVLGVAPGPATRPADSR